jgi:predicted phage-related endonuclease
MIETLLSQKVPGKYFTQMQFQLACTGQKWCDYVVFDPRMPAKAQLFVKRVDRDDAYIAEIEAEIVKFLAEVDSQVNQLNKYIESQP